MKNGDKIKCISRHFWVTVDKEYTAILPPTILHSATYDPDSYVEIVGDHGKLMAVFKHRFVVLEEKKKDIDWFQLNKEVSTM